LVFKDFPGPGKWTIFFIKHFQGPLATLYMTSSRQPSRMDAESAEIFIMAWQRLQ